MLCKNIILMTFYYGHQDAELADNVAALEKKYKGRMKGPDAVSTCSIHVFGGYESRVLDQIKNAHNYNALKATSDNGLYLILHAGPTRSTPEPPVLAKVAGDLIKDGIGLRKINLAACFTAGNKLTNVDKSVLKVFCDSLVKEFT
jgi:hypothetical protein